MCTGVVSVVSVVLRRVEQENEHVAAETTALDGREGEAKGDATLRPRCISANLACRSEGHKGDKE